MAQMPYTPKDVLELAMRREKEGHEFYLRAASGTSNAKGKHMFEWLAQEETKHYQKLESELQALSRTGQWRPPGARSTDKASEPIKRTEFPRLAEVAGDIQPNAGELDALHTGIAAEKQAVELYRHAAENASDAGVKDMFLKLVQEEQGHLDLLESEHEWLAQSGTYFTLHRFSLRGPG